MYHKRVASKEPEIDKHLFDVRLWVWSLQYFNQKLLLVRRRHRQCMVKKHSLGRIVVAKLAKPHPIGLQHYISVGPVRLLLALLLKFFDDFELQNVMSFQ